ncbi:4-coumarate--CoA ligase 2 [Phytophthora cinnamomi]|uniref:4-coumarate--CoA ligase 2 n=1 Tax=Phytophthora cinnamomi TaxID=4785 RepID=UPI003559D8FB|nr:4-coumarate--CoA ligase 2 [Phytophthora cinnamomi]
MTLELHEDDGMFIVFATPAFYKVSSDGTKRYSTLESVSAGGKDDSESGLIIQRRDGQRVRPVLKPDQVTLMVGTGYNRWVGTSEQLPAVMHGMRMPEVETTATQRLLRAWFGKMTLLPSYQRMLAQTDFDEHVNLTSHLDQQACSGQTKVCDSPAAPSTPAPMSASSPTTVALSSPSTPSTPASDSSTPAAEAPSTPSSMDATPPPVANEERDSSPSSTTATPTTPSTTSATQSASSSATPAPESDHGGQEVIELLSSSSDEASSGASPPARARRRGRPRSPSSSSSEQEEKAQLKPARRRVRPAASHRKKRRASSSHESDSSQQESDGSAEERGILAQLKRPAAKKAKVAATKAYVAPAARPRPDRRADGEMRAITEGMSFYELQAQQQMMARFQNQNRRKAPATPTKKAGNGELQANEQKARRSVGSEGESGESEEKDDDDEWDAFTQVSAQKEALRRQRQKLPRDSPVMANRHRETARKSAAFGAPTSGNRRPSGQQQAARKTAVAKLLEQRGAVKKGTPQAIKPSKTRPRVVTEKRSRGSSSEEESEAESEEGSEEPSDQESEDDEVELVAPARQEKSSSSKKTEAKRSHSEAPSAPPNILRAVPTIPYSSGFDKPLWDYDPQGTLKEKCKFVAAIGQGIAITENNFATQPPSQSEVNITPIKFSVVSGTGVYSGRKLRVISPG